jgi:hypothetical protein
MTAKERFDFRAVESVLNQLLKKVERAVAAQQRKEDMEHTRTIKEVMERLVRLLSRRLLSQRRVHALSCTRVALCAIRHACFLSDFSPSVVLAFDRAVWWYAARVMQLKGVEKESRTDIKRREAVVLAVETLINRVVAVTAEDGGDAAPDVGTMPGKYATLLGLGTVAPKPAPVRTARRRRGPRLYSNPMITLADLIAGGVIKPGENVLSMQYKVSGSLASRWPVAV